MLIKVDVDNDLYEQIENLIKDEKYQDVIQFFKISITNQLQEENAESQWARKNEERGSDEPKVKQTNIDKKMKDYLQAQNQVDKSKLALREEKSDLENEYDEFIWSFYNRFFPIKIAINSLAGLMGGQKWVDLNEWQESATNSARIWYQELKEYEITADLKMNEKYSIGLPTDPSELDKIHKRKKKEKIKLEKKILSSKNRFTEQFVGKYNKMMKNFSGACFEMGLLSIKLGTNSCFVSLSDLGLKFAKLDNPILDNPAHWNDNIEYLEYSDTFSNQEVRLIYEGIISKFKVEYKIIKELIEELKQKAMTSDDIQEIFTKYKKSILEYYPINMKNLTKEEFIDKEKNRIIQARVATMGRLSELKIVNWEIKERGISHYSLNHEKCQFLGII
jgi:hypothetical protein